MSMDSLWTPDHNVMRGDPDPYPGNPDFSKIGIFEFFVTSKDSQYLYIISIMSPRSRRERCTSAKVSNIALGLYRKAAQPRYSLKKWPL